MKECENCGKEHDGEYGSGRFCSVKCSRGFSTKGKRKEINEKVRKTLTGFRYVNSKKEKIFPKKRICPECKIEFETFGSNTYCSKKCAAHCPKAPIKDTSRMGGPRPGGGRSIALPYTNWLNESMKLNREEIIIAKLLDKHKVNWKRNSKNGFVYTTLDGKQRKFYPDFLINDSLYLEYKGWVTPEMEHKMKDATKRNNLNLIIVVGEDKRYKDKGISIKELENEIIKKNTF